MRFLFVVFLIGYSAENSCFQGPNYWCLNQTTEDLCHIQDKKIGLCGYTNKRCQIKTGDEFCKSSGAKQQQSPFEFNGGLTGVDEDYFSYYTLSLYWPPSSCPMYFNESRDILRYFCSIYTNVRQPGSERLALHGLWPIFSTNGNYQGWPQFCSTARHDWSKCHIDGDLCPWKNTSLHNFTQGNYELCLSSESIDACLVDFIDVIQPVHERLKILAPGYLNRYNLLMNHEWTKHGSCCSSIFKNNISNYLNYMLDLTESTTQSDSLTYEYIQRYAGEKLGIKYLEQIFNQTAIVNCNSKCQLEELWLCMNRDEQTGLPTRFIACPLGARKRSNSCEKYHCEYVSIPVHKQNFSRNESHFRFLVKKCLFLLLIVFFVKIVFSIFVICYTFCFS